MQSRRQSKGSSSSDSKNARSSQIPSTRQRLQECIIVTDLEGKARRRAISLEITTADREMDDENEIDRIRSVNGSSSKDGDGSTAMMRMLGNIRGRLKVETELENKGENLTKDMSQVNSQSNRRSHALANLLSHILYSTS